MDMETVLEALGWGELVARDVLGVQLLVLTATTAAFAFSLALAILAARAAKRSLKARAEAETCLRSAQDLVVEARQLSAQIDRAATRNAAGVEKGAPVRVSARQTTPEADVAIEREAAADKNLGAAAESASVPKGLWRRRQR
ncbi:MAG TPA: hypothetical protein PKM48_09140 [Parvularculaceae bacterium]|nr:hypothetical protein [Parvularculaceae bacterium]